MKNLLSIIFTAFSLSCEALETFGEDLKIWRLSDKLSLHKFDFDFGIDHAGDLFDFMPVQIYSLIEQVPELLNLDFSLAQGRWDTNLVPRIRNFVVDEEEFQYALPEPITYEASEPGFTLNIFTRGKLDQTNYDKIIGVVSSVLQTAIFEERNEAINIDIGYPQTDSVWTYFAKPFESICQENFKFIFRHLDSFLFDSGIHRLIDSQQLHNTHYKSLRYRLSNEEGKVKLNVEVAYVVGDNKNKKNSSSNLALAFPVSEVVKCVSCDWSKISIARLDGFNTIYDHASPL